MLQSLVAARDPLCRDLRADYRADFVPLGIKLHFETNSQSILDAARAAFGGYGSAQHGNQQFTICLFADPSFNQTPPWPEPIYRGQRDLFYICVGAENIAVADLDKGSAFGFLSPALVQDTKLLRRTFIEGLAFTMATHGKGATHSYIHASAVARGNKGLILSGPAHAGKSTLAYALARKGFHVVADDVVYLRKGDQGLTAWGTPWRLRLAPDSIRLFPELNRIAENLDPTHCCEVVEIDLDGILPGCPQPCCVPAALLFLDRSGGSPICRALDPGEATKLMARDLIFDAREVMEIHQETWMKLAEKGSYTLRYGEDLDSVVETLERLLPSVMLD